MAFADPQAINNLAGTSQNLPRTASGDGVGAFKSSDGSYKLSVSHQYGKRNRAVVRYDYVATVTDPLVPAQNTVANMSTYLVADMPTTGFTAAQQKALVDALVAYLTAGTGSKVTQLLGGES